MTPLKMQTEMKTRCDWKPRHFTDSRGATQGLPERPKICLIRASIPNSALATVPIRTVRPNNESLFSDPTLATWSSSASTLDSLKNPLLRGHSHQPALDAQRREVRGDAKVHRAQNGHSRNHRRWHRLIASTKIRCYFAGGGYGLGISA